jgi:hypothetical protein
MATLIPFLIPTVFLAVALVAVWRRLQHSARADYIRTYTLPPGLFDKLRKKRPELSLKDCQLIAHALRQYFLAYLKGGCRFVSMPSQVVDDLWHELILYTRIYEQFCTRAFGRFMHHTPAVVLSSIPETNAGLRRCWWFACKEENINPRKPTRLPLLFALDAKLNIPDGFRYSVDCAAFKDQRERGARVIHCGGDFVSASYDGTTDGLGDSGHSGHGGHSGDSGGDGGGHGGCSGGCSGGCGGGCGGGGD